MQDGVDDDELSDEEKVEKVTMKIKKNFLGYLKNKPIEMKKMRVLEIYRYIYRFSFFRMQKMIDNPVFIMLIYQYIKASNLERISQIQHLKKNGAQSYRVIENILNNTSHKL